MIPSLKNTMDVVTFRYLALWRSSRWEWVVNATGSGTDANASHKLKQTLEKPHESNINAQAVRDILLLQDRASRFNKLDDRQEIEGISERLPATRNRRNHRKVTHAGYAGAAVKLGTRDRSYKNTVGKRIGEGLGVRHGLE
ncbi:hypothetical protein MRX96_001947 [Rhipicephalus microplus]